MSLIKNPLLVICGCTGCGKSDLAIAIAKKFNGEVVNADSMQIYQGIKCELIPNL
jgi:tRNA dimethylallyltransferase